MAADLDAFERIARRSHTLSSRPASATPLHPFDLHDVHRSLPVRVRELFDNGHYAEATFEACKYVDAEVQRLTASSSVGEALMMAAFNEAAPRISLTALATPTEKDEQRGYKFLFAGLVAAIRNPRGHQFNVRDGVDTCLEHLVFISHLLRRVEKAGFQLT